jgi:glutamate synthase domain-containing protein 3
MTGGRAVILGKTGRNFAAGMSGGIAYVLDLDGTFPALVNREMVSLEDLNDPADQDTVGRLLRRHVQYTASTRGQWVLDHWPQMIGKFVKIMPNDYKAALEKLKQEAQQARDPGRLEVAHG